MRLLDAFRCEPSELALEELRKYWGWRLPQNFAIVVVTAFGDIFFADEKGVIHWLNTGTAEISCVAESVNEFWSKAQSPEGIDWFMPDLVKALLGAGKKRSLGQCYTYTILPIFSDGKYEVWNFSPVDAIEHFGMTGNLLHEIEGLPDGTYIKVVVGP